MFIAIIQFIVLIMLGILLIKPTETRKKMNAVQLTFIVTVNMMRASIIMLSADVAQLGTIRNEGIKALRG